MEEAGTTTAESTESATVESPETSEPETAETAELNEPQEDENNSPVTYNDSQTESAGDVFTISGGTAADGDYNYDTGSLTVTILKSTPMTILSNTASAKIVFADGVDANICLDSLRIKTNDGPAISMGDNSANVTIMPANLIFLPASDPERN